MKDKFWAKYLLVYILGMVGLFTCLFVDNSGDVIAILFFVLIMFPTIYFLEETRKSGNIVIFYLVKVPLFIIFLFLMCGWFFLPVFYYFSDSSSIYYSFCLKLFGGEFGEGFWIILYMIIWGKLGWKLFGKIESGINSIINKFKT